MIQGYFEAQTYPTQTGPLEICFPRVYSTTDNKNISLGVNQHETSRQPVHME